MKKLFLILVIIIGTAGVSQTANMQINPRAKSFRYSSTVEKERPQLDEVTRGLIAAYRQNPTEANKRALREQIAINYDKVLAKKKAKLRELRNTAKDQSKIDEMQTIVNEMVKDRENRINQTLARFTDSRLRPGVRRATDGFLPVLGASGNLSVSYTSVSNKEYAAFIRATERKAPSDWTNGIYPIGKAYYPVTNVSYYDAVAYCTWLSKNSNSATYRLPTEKEWEQAAGHMPKDADFNAGENRGLTQINAYSGTLSASGAINMWGNVWEWTSTTRENGTKAVKGGAWNSKRTECRTENREAGMNPKYGSNNIGFRVFREK